MFFNNDINQDKNSDLTKVAALLIHAAKIDEDYSIEETEIIKQALLKLGADNQDLEKIIEEAKKIEQNSNQILEFTQEIKKMNYDNKIRIIETLWQIIYSNNEADIYETSLMRRLAGLLYIDNKIMGDIKEKIKKENSK
tara:strand:+ start:423 stop:839 length:417 start_codon:yes stop_codon:yes gene_type:complete